MTILNASTHGYEHSSLEFRAGTPKNMREMTEMIEDAFWGYVSNMNVHKDILKWIEDNGGIVGLLKTLYIERYDWNAEEAIALPQMIKFLSDISEVGAQIYDALESDEKRSFQLTGGDSPIGYAGKKFFQSKEIGTRDMLNLELFFRQHLMNMWFQKTNEGLETEKKEQDRFKFGSTLQELLRIIAVPGIFYGSNPEYAKRLMHRLFFLVSQSQKIPIENIRQFNVVMESDFAMDTSSTEGIEGVINNIEKVLRETLGLYAVFEFIPLRVEAVLIGDKDKEDAFRILIVPESNFYFRKSEEKGFDPTNLDNFPEMGAMISDNSRILVRNSNIFEPNGKKTWWGDISQGDTEGIHSTYYILNESEGYRDVPGFVQGNIQATYAAKDPHEGDYVRALKVAGELRDIPYIHPEYIRLKAVYRVQGGILVPNDIQVSLNPLQEIEVK